MMQVQFVLYCIYFYIVFMFTKFMNNYHVHEMFDSWGFLLILFCQKHVLLQSADSLASLTSTSDKVMRLPHYVWDRLQK